MDVVVFYDSSEEQSILGAIILKLKFPAISLQNTKGLNEAAIDGLITAISDDSQHRVYILVATNAGHATGDLTDAQAITLIDKLYTSAVDPNSDDAVRDLGEAASDDQPCLRVWENTYPNKTAPLIVYYLGGVVNTDSMADESGTSTSGTSTTLKDTSKTFVVDVFIGKYIYTTSGTALGQYAKITDNDANSVTFTEWIRRPVGAGLTAVTNCSNDTTYRIVSNVDRLFLDITLPYYIKTYLADLTSNTVMDNWQKLLDKEGNLESNNLREATQDLNYLAEVVAAGLNAYDYSLI